MQMRKTFAVTFAGLATWYIETETKEEAEKEAWDDLIKRNEASCAILRVAPVSDEALAVLCHRQ
jgi:hypothetical protein